jgi:hypothetical protein
MRKALLTVVALALAAVSVRANPYDDFAIATNGDIKGFARDMGGLIGVSDFHSADLPSLGGFDIGAGAAVQSKPDSSDGALTKAGVKAFGLPLARVEAGLPFGASVFLRGVGYDGNQLLGGGARYQLYKSGLLIAIPNVAVTAGYDSLSQDVFKLTHMGASVQASWDIPIVHPFIGVGYDSTKVTIKENVVPSLVGDNDTGTGTRETVGVSLTLIPFTYIYGAYSLMHGVSSGEAGLGIKFGGIL